MKAENRETYQDLYGEDVLTVLGKSIVGWGGERFKKVTHFVSEHPVATAILGGQFAVGTLLIGLGVASDNPILIAYGGLIVWEDAVASAIFLPELKNRHRFINGFFHNVVGA